MTERTIGASPRRSAIAAEQLRVGALILRWPFAAALVALIGFTAFGLLANAAAERPDVIDFMPAMMLPGLLAVFIIAIVVWRDERAARRAYHLAMPIDRSWNHLLRSYSGWPWALGAMLVAAVWGWTVAYATGGRIGVYGYAGVSLHNAPAGVTPEIMAAVDGFEGTVLTAPAWQWVVPFVAAVIVYAAGSAVAIAAANTSRWLLVLFGIYMVVMTIANMTEASPNGVYELLSAPVQGRYGLWTLLSGMSPETLLEAQTDRGTVWLTRWHSDVSTWLLTLAMWSAAAMAALALSLRRHRDI